MKMRLRQGRHERRKRYQLCMHANKSYLMLMLSLSCLQPRLRYMYMHMYIYNSATLPLWWCKCKPTDQHCYKMFSFINNMVLSSLFSYLVLIWAACFTPFLAEAPVVHGYMYVFQIHVIIPQPNNIIIDWAYTHLASTSTTSS